MALKNKQLRVRLTPEELERFQRACQITGRTMSGVVRSLAFRWIREVQRANQETGNG